MASSMAYQNLSKAELVKESKSSTLTSALIAGVQTWAAPVKLPVSAEWATELNVPRHCCLKEIKENERAEELSNLLLCESMAVTQLNKAINSWFGSPKVRLPAGLGLCQSKDIIKKVVEQYKKKCPNDTFLDQTVLARLGYRKFEGQDGALFENQMLKLLQSGSTSDESAYVMEDDSTNGPDPLVLPFRNLASKGQNEKLSDQWRESTKEAISALASAIRKHRKEIAFGRSFEDTQDALLQMAGESGFIKKSDALPRVTPKEYGKAMMKLQGTAYSALRQPIGQPEVRVAIQRFERLTALLANHTGETRIETLPGIPVPADDKVYPSMAWPVDHLRCFLGIGI